MNMNFYTFKRGTVVMADFSPQVGSELKGKHFAIVLTKRDRSTNELLTVVPLTSKGNKHHLDLGDEIQKSIHSSIISRINQLPKMINNQFNENISTNEFDEYNIMCSEIIQRYASLKEHTYAKVHQLTTISKKRITKPVNKLDPIRKLKVSNKVLQLIDKKIVELLTGIDIY